MSKTKVIYTVLYILCISFSNLSSQFLVIDNSGSISTIGLQDFNCNNLDESEINTYFKENKLKFENFETINNITYYIGNYQIGDYLVRREIAFKNESILSCNDQITYNNSKPNDLNNITNNLYDQLKKQNKNVVKNFKSPEQIDIFYSENLKGIHTICSVQIRQEKSISITFNYGILFDGGDYKIDDVNMIGFNTMDISGMVDIFIKDSKNHGIEFNNNLINVTFAELPKGVLGLSYGMYKDELIDIRIDKINWEKSTDAKKWYVLYHELGHDLFNFEHGKGGRMMNPISDRGYSWKEFWEDKDKMFEAYYNE